MSRDDQKRDIRITWMTPKVRMSKDKSVENKHVGWCGCERMKT